MTQRGSILLQAHNIINGERQDQYGNPENSFRFIAKYWQNYILSRFGVDIDLVSKDVVMMQTLFKIAREAHQGKPDNLIDAAGYLGIAGDM